jgi:hypothetical protein
VIEELELPAPPLERSVDPVLRVRTHDLLGKGVAAPRGADDLVLAQLADLESRGQELDGVGRPRQIPPGRSL